MGSTLIERLAAVPEVVDRGASVLDLARRRDRRLRVAAGRRLAGLHRRQPGRTAPRRLVEIDDPCGAPKYSRDGRYLYFARDDRGSECFDIYRYDLASGTCENLLPDTPKPLDLARLRPVRRRRRGSPSRSDHERGVRGGRHARRVSPGGADIRLLDRPPDNDWAPGLVARRPPHRLPQRHATARTASSSSSTSTAARRARSAATDPVLAWEPRWSPDGDAHRLQRRARRPLRHRPLRRASATPSSGPGTATGLPPPGLVARRPQARLPRRGRRPRTRSGTSISPRARSSSSASAAAITTTRASRPTARP